MGIRVEGRGVSARSDYQAGMEAKLSDIRETMEHLVAAHKKLFHLKPANTILNPERLEQLRATIRALHTWQRLIQDDLEELAETYGAADEAWVNYGR